MEKCLLWFINKTNIILINLSKNKQIMKMILKVKLKKIFIFLKNELIKILYVFYRISYIRKLRIKSE
jgi:hypothetical protein